MTKSHVAWSGFLCLAVLLAVLPPASCRSAAQAATSDAQPVARKHHAVAYDRRSGRVVLYGGATNEGQTLDDFWSWDGSRWDLIARSTPASGHALFADEDGTLFLVGGVRATTSRWDGSAWVPMLDEPARWGIAGAHDAPRGRFVLHGGGGRPGQTFGDTLEFDGESWRQVATGGPSPRRTAGMVFDTARNLVVLFGGLSLAPTRRLDDLWEWDGVQWRPVDLSAGERPPARGGFAMTYDEVRREVVLFGGLDADGVALSDTWLWNGGQWRRHEGDGPSARDEAYMAFDAARGVAVLFGGISDDESMGLLGDTWEWDGSRWTRPGPTASRATVTISYRARTRPRTDLPSSVQACIVGVGETHVHPSWGENYRALRAVGDQWELTVNDAPVGPVLTLLVHDGNTCDENATGTVTRNVFVNDVSLTQIVSAPVLFPPGSPPEPGLAFSLAASGRVSP